MKSIKEQTSSALKTFVLARIYVFFPVNPQGRLIQKFLTTNITAEHTMAFWKHFDGIEIWVFFNVIFQFNLSQLGRGWTSNLILIILPICVFKKRKFLGWNRLSSPFRRFLHEYAIVKFVNTREEFYWTFSGFRSWSCRVRSAFQYLMTGDSDKFYILYV